MRKSRAPVTFSIPELWEGGSAHSHSHTPSHVRLTSAFLPSGYGLHGIAFQRFFDFPETASGHVSRYTANRERLDRSEDRILAVFLFLLLPFFSPSVAIFRNIEETCVCVWYSVWRVCDRCRSVGKDRDDRETRWNWILEGYKSSISWLWSWITGEGECDLFIFLINL